MINRNVVLIVVFLLISPFTYSQKDTKKLAKANKEYDDFSFVKANKLYRELVKKGDVSAEVYAKLGDTYYFNSDYLKALEAYYKMVELNEPFEPEYYYRYAQCLKVVERYSEASKMMELYYNAIGEKADKDDVRAIANPRELINEQSGRYTITPQTKINTKSSDFGTVFNGDKEVFYTSVGTQGAVVKRLHSWNEKAFLKLFSATVDANGNLHNPNELKGEVNSIYHQTSPAITKDGKTMYFTRNNYFEKDLKRDNNSGVNKLKIYRAHKVGDKWEKVEELPFPINSDIFSSAHPALGPDDRTLYFVSDRDNKPGNTDIFSVGITKTGTFENNLKPLGKEINTLGRETFPSVDDYGILYFASDGHIGLGGLDVFAAVEDNKGIYHVFNIGEPINSKADDFAYIFNQKTKRGFFSSNREEGEGEDDIYSFLETKPPVYPFRLNPVVHGVIKDSISGGIIPNVQISVFNDKNEKVTTVMTNEKGEYTIDDLVPLGDYTFVFEREGFSKDEVFVKGLKIQSDKNLPVRLFSQLVVIVDNEVVFLKEGDDLTSKLKLKPIYFDYGVATIRKSSKRELDKVISVLKHHPSVSIYIKSHTDSRGNAEFNLMLSEKRAQATVDYIVEKGGEIFYSRVKGKGYGDTQLLNGCEKGVKCTEEEHQLNRRSEFIINIKR